MTIKAGVGTAVSGATAGFSVGGVYGAAVGGVIGGIVGLFGGDNAAAAREAAMTNARMATETAKANMASEVSATQANNAILVNRAVTSNKVQQLTTDLNVSLIKAKTTYQSLLLDNEESKLWEGLDLNIEKREKMRASQEGSWEARAAASGTVVGEGSNADVSKFIRSEASFDEMVMRYNADVGATDILNARAKGDWEGTVATQQAIWNGSMTQASTNINTVSQIAANSTQSTLKINAETQQTNLNSWAIVNNGNAQADQLDSKATQDMVSSIFSGASSVATIAATNFKLSGGASYTSPTADGSSLLSTFWNGLSNPNNAANIPAASSSGTSGAIDDGVNKAGVSSILFS